MQIDTTKHNIAELTIDELVKQGIGDGLGSIAVSYIVRAYQLGTIHELARENARLAMEIERLRTATAAIAARS